jgi:hypothetical protein
VAHEDEQRIGRLAGPLQVRGLSQMLPISMTPCSGVIRISDAMPAALPLPRGTIA